MFGRPSETKGGRPHGTNASSSHQLLPQIKHLISTCFTPTIYEVLTISWERGEESRDTDLDVFPAKLELAVYFEAKKQDKAM